MPPLRQVLYTFSPPHLPPPNSASYVFRSAAFVFPRSGGGSLNSTPPPPRPPNFNVSRSLPPGIRTGLSFPQSIVYTTCSKPLGRRIFNG